MMFLLQISKEHNYSRKTAQTISNVKKKPRVPPVFLSIDPALRGSRQKLENTRSVVKPTTDYPKKMTYDGKVIFTLMLLKTTF